VAPNTGFFTLKTTGIVDDLEAGAKIAGPVSIYGRLSGQLTSGLDASSIVVAGSSYEASLLGGVALRILRIDGTGTQIGARLFVAHGAGEGLDLLPLARTLTASNLRNVDLSNVTVASASAKLIQTTFLPSSFTEGGASLHVAQTIVSCLSLQAALSATAVSQSGVSTDRTTGAAIDESGTDPSVSGSFALTFDAGPIGPPLALMAEYGIAGGRLRPAPRGATETAHQVALGLYFTGSRTLELGAGVATEIGMPSVLGSDDAGKPHVSETPTFVVAQLHLRHAW
jgi:hypothetical protein